LGAVDSEEEQPENKIKNPLFPFATKQKDVLE
jgi:hypothetical protein